MYPGPNDTDWQVAKFQHRELVAMGQHQQFVARVLTATPSARPASPSIRRQLGTLLVCVGQRLQFLISIITADPRVQTINLSRTIDNVPAPVLAASFDGDPARFAVLPKRGNVGIAAPVEG
jgi:hypothetical protein